MWGKIMSLQVRSLSSIQLFSPIFFFTQAKVTNTPSNRGSFIQHLGSHLAHEPLDGTEPQRVSTEDERDYAGGATDDRERVDSEAQTQQPHTAVEGK